jgi:hypothetical protein
MQTEARDVQPCPVKWIIAPTIVVVDSQSRTHLQSKIRRYGNVASIEETVQVGSQQKSVPDLMGAVLSI